MNDEERNKDDILEYYLSMGVVKLEGMDESGEIIYSIDEELAKEYAPELWQSHVEYVDRSLMDLYEKGLVEIEYDENLEATIHLNEEGFRIAKENGLIEIDPETFRNIPND